MDNYVMIRTWIQRCTGTEIHWHIMAHRYIYTRAACFAAGHWKICRRDRRLLDTAVRKFRTLVGPPSWMDWTRPWHETLRDWNVRLDYFLTNSRLNFWSQTSTIYYWKLARYISGLPSIHWVARAAALGPIKSPKDTSTACPQIFQESHIKLRKCTSIQRNSQVHGPIWRYQANACFALKCICSYGKYRSRMKFTRTFGNQNTMATATGDKLFFLLLLQFTRACMHACTVP